MACACLGGMGTEQKVRDKPLRQVRTSLSCIPTLSMLNQEPLQAPWMLPEAASVVLGRGGQHGVGVSCSHTSSMASRDRSPIS